MRGLYFVLFLILSFAGYGQQSAANFNGTSSYIQVLDANAIDLSANLTLEAWIYPTGPGSATTDGGTIINKENSYELARFANGTIQFGLSANGAGTDWAWVNTSLVAPLNQWSHVALVKSGTTVTVYLNSSASSIHASQPATLTANTQNLRIGGRVGGSQFFAGIIDEVRIWNVARTQAEVKNYIFNQNLSSTATGLVSYYMLNTGSGTTATNTATNFGSLNGTLTNTTWIASPIQFANNALAFDGIDDIVTTQLSISGLSAFTLEGWVYLRSGGNRIAFFGQNDAIEFGLSSANTINGWTANGSSLSWTFDNTNFPLNAWHHVAFVGNGTSLTLYTDGVQRATTAATTANYGTSVDRFNMGGAVWDNTGNNLNGILDEVRVWNVARTQSQVQTNMTRSLDPVTSTGLIANYWFNEGVSTGNNTGLVTVHDRKGNNNGTLNNFNLTSGNTTSNFIVQSHAVLPLRFLSFTAKIQSKNVLLEWSTADEKNTKEFVVQHSVNNTTWQDIGNVATTGNDLGGVNHYQFIHNEAVNGVNYYRLLQRDIDDVAVYSVIRSVKVSEEERSFAILNNPVSNGMLSLQVNKETAVSLYNQQGQIMLTGKLSVGNSRINISHYPNGIYLVKSGDYVVRIIKQ